MRNRREIDFSMLVFYNIPNPLLSLVAAAAAAAAVVAVVAVVAAVVVAAAPGIVAIVDGKCAGFD